MRPLRLPRAPRGPLILVVAILLAWSAMAGMLLAPGGTPRAGSAMTMPGMPMMHMARVDSSARLGSDGSAAMQPGSDPVADLAMWQLMVVAMMLPTALPAVRHVARHSLAWRRGRATAAFVGAYLLVWLAAGLLVELAVRLWSGADPTLVFGGVLAAAAVWQLTPSKLPALSHVARRSLAWRRGRATAAFVGAYLLVWVAAGLLMEVAVRLWSGADPTLVFGGALAAAAVWQLMPSKRIALSDCHRSIPLPAKGWRADRAVLEFAVRNGSACVRSCWAMMLAMAVANSAALMWMAVLAIAAFAEKRAQRPRHVSRLVAAALSAAAGIVLAGGVLA